MKLLLTLFFGLFLSLFLSLNHSKSLVGQSLAADNSSATGKAQSATDLREQILKQVKDEIDKKKEEAKDTVKNSSTEENLSNQLPVPQTSVSENVKGVTSQGNLAKPGSVNAQGVATGALSGIQSIYQILRSQADFASGRLDVEQWFKDIIGTAVPNISLLILGGPECDNTTVWGPNKTCQWALPTDAFLTLDQEKLKGAGFAGFVTTTSDGFSKEMPVPGNMSYYYKETLTNSMFKKTAFAQGINVTQADAFFANVVFAIWKITRNIAMTLVAVLLGLGALGVMFRQRVSGQAVVTIYSLLPYVPVVIFLILFSYPVMVIAMNVAMILWNAVGAAAQAVGSEFAGEGFGDASTSRPAIAILSGVINGNFNALIDILPASLSSVYMILFIMFMIVAMGVVFIYQYAKVYLKFVTYTVFMPLIILTALVPGRQWIILYFFKKVLVEILLAPYIITSFFIALALISTISGTENQIAGGFSYLSQTIGILVVYVISWGLVWGIGKVRKNLESFFGASGSIFAIQDLKKA